MAGGDKNKDNLGTKRKSGGSKEKGEDNRRTKLKSASAKRANAAENPHIPRPRKKGPLEFMMLNSLPLHLSLSHNLRVRLVRLLDLSLSHSLRVIHGSLTRRTRLNG
jgi:hypothetical protein